MRSILSRFTLYSVAALALSGLIAGCSGGTSSSLPGGTSAGNATGGSLSAHMMMAKLQEQIRNNSFPKAPTSGVVVHRMTGTEVNRLEAAIGIVNGHGPNRTSHSSDIPGGFGFVTTTSPPGPYSGIQGQFAAYCVGPPFVTGCSASVGPPFFHELIPPGPPPVAFSVSSDVIEVMVAPGGGCYIPIVEYMNTETFSGGTFHQQPNNWFDFLNECSHTGNALPIDQPFLSNAFITPSSGTNPPTLSVETHSVGGPENPTGTWTLSVFNHLLPGFVDFTGFDSGAPATGFQALFAGAGFAGYAERSLAIGPCQALPNATGGLGITNINMFNSTTGLYTPLAPSMPGGTMTAFAQPNTNSQTCFANDGTGVGEQYLINNGGGFPFYTAGGGQMTITSFP